MKSQLDRFLEGTQPNKWLALPHMDIYVRKGLRVIDHQKLRAFDIGNISVAEKHQCKGIFTAFFDTIFKKVSGEYDIIYIENVLTPRFANYFRRRGWKEVPVHEVVAKYSGPPPSFYLPLPKDQDLTEIHTLDAWLEKMREKYAKDVS